MNRRSRHARWPLLIGLLFLLALIPFALFRGSQVPEAEAAWWNESWQYRQSIAVTNNTTQQTNVYISVSLDTSNTSKFQADCGDLRFTKQNGQLLPYYIVSGCGTASTSVHFQLDTFPAGAQTFFAYYGNPSADNGFSSNDFLTEATSYTVGGTGSEEVGPGPVAHWKFDEGSGSTAHDSASYATGDELLADGNMEATDTNAWSASNAILSKQTTLPHGGLRCLRVARTGSNAVARQAIMTIGKRYKISGFARGDGTNGPQILDGVNILWTGTSANSWQEFSKEFVATTINIDLNSSPTIGNYVEFDDVIVREVSGNNGTITGATWANEDQCVSGKCLSFDGTNDYVDMGNASRLEGFSNVTVSFWYKTATLPSSITTVIGKEGVYKISLNQSGQIRFLTGNNWAGSILTTSTTLSPGTWYHITATYDGSIKRVYINGTPDTSTVLSSGSLGSSSNKFVIGATSSPGIAGFTPGLIDEPKIFPYTLTEDQIKAEYNLGAAVMGTGPTVALPAGGNLSDSLVAYWAFDEQYGQTAHDKVGNNHGTLSGATWQPSGKLNSAVGFADNGSYVDSTSDISIGTEDFSVSGWIYLKSSPPSGTLSGGIIGTGVNSGTQIFVTPNGQVRVRNYTGTTYSGWEFWSTEPLPIDQWTHFTYVADRDGSAFFYLNGQANGQHDISSRSTQEILIRPRMGHNQWLALPEDNRTLYGHLDEVKIYNTALTADQVKQDMNAGASVAYSVGSEEADELADGAGAPPIAEWKFDEKQGTLAYDSSGNANDGTVNGATWKSGCQQGACLEFDGVDDYVSSGNPSDLQLTEGSVGVWIRTNGAGAGYRGIVVKQNAYGLFLRDNEVGVYSWGDSSWRGTGIVLADSAWHYISFTFKDGVENQTNIYLDGRLVANTKITITSQANNVLIGHGNTSGQNFAGQIDHVRIYDYVRTPAQIAYDYNRGAPVAHWKFDECEGTVAHDASGNENHGTITIGATGTQTTAGTCSISGAWANGASGKFAGSLNFDGTDDYVDANITLSTIPFSLSAWVKTTASQTTPGIVSFSDPNGYRRDLYIFNNDKLRIFTYNGTTALYHVSPTIKSLNDGQWHHIVGTFDGTTPYVYADGVRYTVGSPVSASTYPASKVRIGAINHSSMQPNYYFNGQIDDVRIYNYALSPAQVTRVMNEGFGVKYGPVIGNQ